MNSFRNVALASLPVRKTLLTWLAIAWIVALPASRSPAASILLGPSPYSSRADSPFPVNADDSTFFLEDFEDGALNTPGIKQHDFFPPELGGAFLGQVTNPGARAHSVDGDDGIIDGYGEQGRGFRNGLDITVPTLPPRHQYWIAFDFEASPAHPLPNAFGFVWTDGAPGATLAITLMTELGETINHIGLTLGEETSPPSANDRFIGVRTSDPIRSVYIVAGITGEPTSSSQLRIDHVQYGRLIPEPSAFCLAAMSILNLLGFTRGAARWDRGPFATSDSLMY